MEIQSCSFGEIVIDGKNYDSDLIFYQETIYPNWWRMSGHLLHIDDIKNYLKMGPKTLIIGTGHNQMMKVGSETKIYLKEKNINVVIEPTPKAWKTFNSIKEKENVMAAFHLTC